MHSMYKYTEVRTLKGMLGVEKRQSAGPYADTLVLSQVSRSDSLVMKLGGQGDHCELDRNLRKV